MKIFIQACVVVYMCAISVTRAQENNPLVNSREVLIEAFKYLEDKKYDEAIAEFRKIPVNDTNYVLAMIELTAVYSKAGKDSLAIQLCDQMLKERTQYGSQFLIAKGNAYDNMKKADLAALAYDEAEKLFPMDYLIHFNRGVMLLGAEKYAEAEKCFQKVLKINPFHTSTLIRLAQLNIKYGRITPAMMCMQFSLLIDNSSDRSRQVLVLLEQLVKNELDDEMTAKLPYGETDDFTELDELIRSKIALSDKYKSKTKLNFPMTKQVQVLLEKVKYNKSSAGFYMEFFARFFEALNKEGHTEAYIYTMLSGLKIEDVDKWMRSNSSRTTKLIQWAVAYINKNMSTYEADLNGKKEMAVHYFSDGRLIAIGNKDASGNNTGYWKYYYDMYTPKSEGMFVNGMKEGKWKYYYKTGVLKEESNYVKDMYDGEVKEFHELGTLSVQAMYAAGVPQGNAAIFDIAGNKVNEFYLEKGIKNGKQKTYYPSGGLNTELNYVNGKSEGVYVQYYESGNLKEEGNLTGDAKNGPVTGYHDAPGKPVEFKGTYKNNDPVGEWKYYTVDGVLSSEGVFDEKGKKNGKWKSYHENGKPMAEYEYSKGEIDGLYNLYDTTGTPYASYTYKSGQLKEYTFTFNGKVTEKNKESGRELVFNEYYFNGNPMKKGKFVSGKEEGKWEEYNFSGYKTTEYTYKDGQLEGDFIEYHPTGGIKTKVTYVAGEPDGYLKRYYVNGQLEEEGWFVKGERQGNWYRYWIDGTIKTRHYYLNNELYGWQQYFAVNGKLEHEEKYEYSQFSAIKYFDTTGAETARYYLDKGDGTINGPDVVGRNRSKLSYKGGNSEGMFEWTFCNGRTEGKGTFHNDERHGTFEDYYPDGTKRAEINYRFGELDGNYKLYYPNGKLMDDYTYLNGERHGLMKSYYENGQLYREDLCKNGEATSIRLYDETGQMMVHRKYYHDLLSSVNTYTADQKFVEIPVKNETGKVVGYYSNKMKSIECEYKNGVLVGKRNTYYSNGKPYEEETFVNGEEEGISKIYYASGKLKRLAHYLTGELHGEVVTYHPNGKVKSREVYRCGERHGVCRYYNENEALTVTRTYYNDQLIEEKTAK